MHNRDTVSYNIQQISHLDRTWKKTKTRGRLKTQRSNSYNLVHSTCVRKNGEIIRLYDLDDSVRDIKQGIAVNYPVQALTMGVIPNIPAESGSDEGPEPRSSSRSYCTVFSTVM